MIKLQALHEKCRPDEPSAAAGAPFAAEFGVKLFGNLCQRKLWVPAVLPQDTCHSAKSLCGSTAARPEGGLSSQKMEEIKGALRELGLDDRIH